MTREENIRAILDTCFSESKDEIKEVALNNIMSLSTEAVQGWIPCNLCKHYQGVHGVQGHAPCDYWKCNGVMYNWFCSQWKPYKGGEE